MRRYGARQAVVSEGEGDQGGEGRQVSGSGERSGDRVVAGGGVGWEGGREGEREMED